MDLYNNAISKRINGFVRTKIRMPILRRRNENCDWTLICNNCLGGLVTHDFGQQFRSPTVNLFFPDRSFFDFVEHMEYYLEKQLEDGGVNKDPQYPIGVLKGDGEKPDILVHFMHYRDFKEASEKWNERKKRMNKNNIYVVWTFAFDNYTQEDYKRFQALPVEKKVGFVNKSELCKTYDNMYYIKGFEKKQSLGNILQFSNLFGKRYYDQFDFIKWFSQ
ncbi:MAG: DUF1919 domain-containing protein [Clostridia bacterium]|nr:DUF1919 domain-containing protein [Clostridia bacterium]